MAQTQSCSARSLVVDMGPSLWCLSGYNMESVIMHHGARVTCLESAMHVPCTLKTSFVVNGMDGKPESTEWMGYPSQRNGWDTRVNGMDGKPESTEWMGYPSQPLKF
jgi:hypothetical protein